MLFFHRWFIISILTAICAQSSLSQDSLSYSPGKNRKILKINIYGNNITKVKVIKQLMNLDTGMVFDSLELRKSEKKLEETNLFSKVDAFALIKNEGVEVFVILEEKLYVSPGGGGMWYSYKYGEKDLWLRLELGLSINNFRGMMENFQASVSVWDWRSISFSWSKPILPSDYFFTISTGIDYYPDEIKTTDHFMINSRFRFGRKINNRSKISLGVNPTLRKDATTKVDSISQNAFFTHKSFLKNYELFGSLFWISDFRRPYFDPCRGWLGYAEIKSNHLYSGKFDPFIQFTTNFAFYHSGILSDHKVAYRLQTVFRNDKGGPLHIIQMGGNGSLRGYLDGALGYIFEADNSLLFSMEYRFPLLEMPPLKLPILGEKNKAFAALRYRIDGAFIADYGRLSERTTDLLGMTKGSVESGTGLGFGLRVMLLNLERSVAADVVWGKDNTSKVIRFKKIPTLHTYIDLYF